MMKLFRMFAIAAIFHPLTHAEAEERMSVPPGKGSVDASGKFVPSEPAAPNPAVETREQLEAKMRDSMRVEQLSPGCFRIGRVSFDQKRREVTIPATVNMESGLVEYALVAETGKVHEAVFTTTANPMEIHLASLLLGMAPATEEDAPGNKGKPGPAGREIRITVTWDTNGPPAEHELATMVATTDQPSNPVDAKPLAGGPWRYVGSITGADGFAAAKEGSIISLISDPSALVINPREDSKRDDVHIPNRHLLPTKGSPVRIVLALPSSPSPKP